MEYEIVETEYGWFIYDGTGHPIEGPLSKEKAEARLIELRAAAAAVRKSPSLKM